MSASRVITIGNFDGVHRGHAALLREARRLAGNGRVVALTFHPHPIAVLRPALAPAALTTFEYRCELLRAAGADEVVRLDPTPELLNLSPEEFVERLIAEHHPAAVVEGTDFRFGRARAGDTDALRRLGRERGLEVSVINPVEIDLSDQTIVTASSTIVRWLVARGRVTDAARVLGREYVLTGNVVRGDRRGREIGFPTANLSTECLLPGDGVYAGRALLPDGRELSAAIHVGPRATFASAARTVEAFVMDWRGPLDDGWAGAEEYGWPLRLAFTAFLRDQAKFESIAALVEQIERDVARARGLLAPGGARRKEPVSA